MLGKEIKGDTLEKQFHLKEQTCAPLKVGRIGLVLPLCLVREEKNVHIGTER